MSTRAAIGFEFAPGEYHMIYSHYDGYPKHVGKILREYWSNISLAGLLVYGPQIRNFDHDGTVVRFADNSPPLDPPNDFIGDYERYESIEQILDSGFDYAYLFDEESESWKCYGRDALPMFHVTEFEIPG